MQKWLATFNSIGYTYLHYFWVYFGLQPKKRPYTCSLAMYNWHGKWKILQLFSLTDKIIAHMLVFLGTNAEKCSSISWMGFLEHFSHKKRKKSGFWVYFEWKSHKKLKKHQFCVYFEWKTGITHENDPK